VESLKHLGKDHLFMRRFVDWLAWSVFLLFALDRALKHLAIWHFFHRPRPAQPPAWPTVTLLQPITRDASNLEMALRARAQLNYSAPLQHVLICDANDPGSQMLVSAYLAEFPALQAELVLVHAEDNPGGIATKIRKLQKALPYATGEIVCFVDDDVAPRPDTLQLLIPHLLQPGTGAAFGLPCYTNWRTPWSSLMSGFVNANMLLNFVALTYLAQPFRITGHFVAFHHLNLKAAGGLAGLEQFIDDDFELARRLHARKLRCVQTPLVYDIDNELLSFSAYQKQLKRWFVLPRQAMMPSLTLGQLLIASLATISLAFPGALLILTLCTRQRAAFSALLASLGVFASSYMLCERHYLQGHLPLRRWPLLLVVALLTPLEIARHLLSNDEIEWRGQLLRIQRGGQVEVKA